MRLVVVLMAVIAIGATSVFFYARRRVSTPAAIPETTQTTTSTPAAELTSTTTTPPEAATTPTTPAEKPVAVEPVDQLKSRITKKPFGLYVTPQNSPVQPERFTGYHTGVDVEYGDVENDVPVKAIADGEVVLARTADGYGGVIAIRHTLKDQKVVAIYGHIRPSTLPKIGATVHQGDQIGVLGKGFSTETDGERKHLHFAIHKGEAVNIKGYVQNQSELTGWYDPLEFY